MVSTGPQPRHSAGCPIDLVERLRPGSAPGAHLFGKPGRPNPKVVAAGKRSGIVSGSYCQSPGARCFTNVWDCSSSRPCYQQMAGARFLVAGIARSRGRNCVPRPRFRASSGARKPCPSPCIEFLRMSKVTCGNRLTCQKWSSVGLGRPPWRHALGTHNRSSARAQGGAATSAKERKADARRGFWKSLSRGSLMQVVMANSESNSSRRHTKHFVRSG